jgi:hypothetical protein
VTWSALPEAEKDKDRQAVRSLPRVLADLGLEIVRVSEPVVVPAQSGNAARL